jgi:hypothetical protein
MKRLLIYFTSSWLLVLIFPNIAADRIIYEPLLARQKIELKSKMEEYKYLEKRINAEILKQKQKEKELYMRKIIQQETENNIYRMHLASRIKSSILNDFLTMRY